MRNDHVTAAVRVSQALAAHGVFSELATSLLYRDTSSVSCRSRSIAGKSEKPEKHSVKTDGPLMPSPSRLAAHSMSAERLAVGDLVRCSRCRKWHPAATWASGSTVDYAEKMLIIRCGTVRFFVGTIGGPARDLTAVKSPRGAGTRELTRSSDRPGIDDIGKAS